jgi:hypothetical protein
MDVDLTRREIEFIIEWKGRPFFPDEERVLSKLRRALEEDGAPCLALSRFQIQVVSGWLEEQSASHRGGGDVLTPEESIILGKLRRALE